jgi:hypothetical protein
VQAKWGVVWPGVGGALNLHARTTPALANWMAERTDDDETALAAAFARTAAELALDVAADAVAAAKCHRSAPFSAITQREFVGIDTDVETSRAMGRAIRCIWHSVSRASGYGGRRSYCLSSPRHPHSFRRRADVVRREGRVTRMTPGIEARGSRRALYCDARAGRQAYALLSPFATKPLQPFRVKFHNLAYASVRSKRIASISQTERVNARSCLSHAARSPASSV